MSELEKYEAGKMSEKFKKQEEKKLSFRERAARLRDSIITPVRPPVTIGKKDK